MAKVAPDISSLLIQDGSGSEDRVASSAARSLARGDEQVFASLRLPPIAGETGLDNMLRQIEALMQAPAPPALPAPDRPPREAKRTRPAAPPARPERPRADGRRERSALGRIAFGLTALGLACVAVFPGYPDRTRRIAAHAQAETAPSAPAATPALGVAIVAIPGAPTSASALTAPSPTKPLPVQTADAAPRSGAIAPVPPVPATPTRTAAPAPPAAESAKPVARVRPAPPAADPGAVAMLLDRGRQLLAAGDVASARQFFERAHEWDAAAGAGAIAATYDPAVLHRMGAVGVKADAALAAQWYRRAAEAGDAEAGDALRRLANSGNSAKAGVVPRGGIEPPTP